MKVKIYSMLFFIFSASILFSQRVVVNEFSQGPSGSKEWLELLVINSNVNLSGIKIKDGNSTYRLIFKNNALWANISAGSIIVVFNGGDKDSANLPPNDYSFLGDYKVVIPHNDTSLFSTSSTGGWPSGWFANTTNTDNPAIVNPDDSVIWDWNTHGPGTSIRPGANQVSGYGSNSVAGMTNSANWIRGAAFTATAGLGNNPDNVAWINSLRGVVLNTTVQFTQAGYFYSENAGVITINVSISNPSSTNATTVEVALTGGTATNGVDYSNFTTQTLTFPAGSSANQSFTVNIIDDSEIESDETIIFTLQNPSGGTNATLGTITTFTLTIQDNDTPIPLLPVSVAREDLNGDWIPDRLGQMIKLRGVVIGPNYQTSNFSYYIQDGNAGISVFRSGSTLPILNLGDSIEVKGMIEHYRGLTEITFSNTSDLIPLGTGAIPEPQILSISSYKSNPEMYEGVLLKFTNVIKVGGTWPTAGQSATIQIAQGTDTLDLRIDSDTDIDDNAEPTWPRNTKGIGSQFTSSVSAVNDGYQLLPRYYSDFEPATSIEGENINIPNSMKLFNIFPNPFNPITKIRYQIPEHGQVRLKIFNVLGKEILELENTYKKPGTYELEFNADKYGLTSGVYLLQLTNRNSIATKKFILMK